ncbi:MAG: class I SAM-dependent methyltransferase [Verrucomicrobiota bacterium]
MPIALASQPSPDTNAWRIHHDAARGIWIDTFDGNWLVQTQQNSLPKGIIDSAKSHAHSLYWKPRDAAASTEPEHQWGEIIKVPFSVTENGARFRIDFSAGYSPGIFLDQRLNRREVWQRSKKSASPKVLNAFAYTGAFSVMAALGGAQTSTLDLSKTYLDWCWENFALNDLDRETHYGVKGDAFDWLASFARKERKFHGIVLDPPTFSRNKKRTFRTDRDYAELAKLGVSLLEPGGWILCCANTHRMNLRDFEKQVKEGIRLAGRRVSSIASQPMPDEFRGDDYLKSLWVDVD